MKKTHQKATIAVPNKEARAWWIIDADGKVLGRTASQIAKTLRGKNKAIYTPHVDAGDFVIVVNCEKVKLTGKKLDDKVYNFFSGYVGGLRQTAAKDVLAKKPELLLREAVKGMLPKTALGEKLLKKLKIYKGSEHPHKAQMPKPLSV